MKKKIITILFILLLLIAIGLVFIEVVLEAIREADK